MKRLIKKDPFFDKQPPLEFINELKAPLHKEKPKGYGKRERQSEEIDARGMCLANEFPKEYDRDGVLETVYRDIKLFLDVYGIAGERYPIRIEYGSTECFEAYTVDVREDGVSIIAADTEGVRRGLIYLEDELRRAEAAYLCEGKITRKPLIKTRITRCFFSPINRAPKFGDELSDDIDYYPEEYLNRLMHDGANGVWIYTRFSQLLPSDYIKENGVGYEARIEKLRRTVEKCKKYGIGVYVFAIEPVGLTHEQYEKYPEMAGHVYNVGESYNRNTVATFCTASKMGAEYCYEQGKKLVELVPGIAGLMSITQGERITGCSSVNDEFDAKPCRCPRCSGKRPSEILATSEEALRSGIRAVDPSVKFISWTYGARSWKIEEIRHHASIVPDDVMLMQNFDDMGYEEQLGKMRLGVDYWLSYIGPSQLFTETADQALKSGKHMFAKMQVCCSHEIASVPYVPVPGILYKKYKAARQYNVDGILQCWYFGNYPSLMSKCAGELSFIEDFSNEREFLERLAAIYFGKSKASKVADAWELFEKGYVQYPMNIMFSYYGPMHDGVVWKLALKPKNFSLPRSWQGVDPIDGDRIGECLLNGHTIDEAVTLLNGMNAEWKRGCDILSSIEEENEDEREQISLAGALNVLFDSGRNIVEFYQNRERLGLGIGDASATLARMRKLVELEIANSTEMIERCAKDARLGYHSEAESYKFFKEKLVDRIESLNELLATEFPEVQERIEQGKAPLEYYDGIEDNDSVKRYKLVNGLPETADWEIIDEHRRFRSSYIDGELYMEFEGNKLDGVSICPEYKLLWPSIKIHIDHSGNKKLDPNAKLSFQLFGDRYESELAKYSVISLSEDRTHFLVKISLEDAGLVPLRPFKMKLCIGGQYWCREDEPVYTLGKGFVSPGDYGWFLPEK